MRALEPDELPGDARHVLAGLIESLADNKAALGRRYGEWAVSAPTLESAVAAAAMAQDELGHARSTYPLLKDLGVCGYDGPASMEPSGCIPLLGRPLPDWETFVAVNLVVDGMFTAFIETGRNSVLRGLQQRARKILQEERSHGLHASVWARRLAADSRGVDELPLALLVCWEQIAEWPGSSQPFATLVDIGLLNGSPDSIRQRVRARVGEALDGTAVDVHLP